MTNVACVSLATYEQFCRGEGRMLCSNPLIWSQNVDLGKLCALKSLAMLDKSKEPSTWCAVRRLM